MLWTPEATAIAHAVAEAAAWGYVAAVGALAAAMILHRILFGRLDR